MANLYEILSNAQNGEAIDRLSRQFNLSPEETEQAVAALLPAISRGLKQSTATPEGLGGLLSMMANQQDLYDDDAAFGDTGRTAGNDALGQLFGSKDVSRAVAAQAQQASGIGSAILKQMLPVIIGMILSGLLKGLGGGGAQGQPIPMPMPDRGGQGPRPGGGGGLEDILGDILGQNPRGQNPGGGRPFPIPMPDQGQGPSGGGASPGGGGFLDQILRDMLGGGRAPGGGGSSGGGLNPRDLKDLSDLSNQMPLKGGGYGETLFGDMFEPGQDVDRDYDDNIRQLFDQMFGGRR